MKVSSTTLGLLVGFGQLVSAQASCSQYSGIARLMSSSSATNFCSQFLTVSTSTFYQSTTQVGTFLTTSTTTITESTTVTVLTQTSVDTSTTITTVPTVVSTRTIPSVSVFQTFVTPPTVTVTVTSWSTPPAAKKARRTAGVQGRVFRKRQNNNIPGYLRPFGTAALSAGCGCLTGAFAIVTPTVTSVITIPETTSITEGASATSVSVIQVTVTTTRTETTLQTFLSPQTVTTTSVSTSTSTSTLATPTSTVTSTKAIPPACTSALAGRRLFNNVSPNRSLFYTPSEQFQVPFSGELGASICCARCWETPNCGGWFVWQPSAAANYMCRFYIGDGQLTTNIKPICPRGVPNASSVSGRTGAVPGTQNTLFPIGVGPCFFAQDSSIPGPQAA